MKQIGDNIIIYSEKEETKVMAMTEKNRRRKEEAQRVTPVSAQDSLVYENLSRQSIQFITPPNLLPSNTRPV